MQETVDPAAASGCGHGQADIVVAKLTEEALGPGAHFDAALVDKRLDDLRFPGVQRRSQVFTLGGLDALAREIPVDSTLSSGDVEEVAVLGFVPAIRQTKLLESEVEGDPMTIPLAVDERAVDIENDCG